MTPEFKLRGKIDRERNVRHLALSIGTNAAISPLQHDVVKINRFLTERGNIDDPGGATSPEQRQE